MRFINEEGDVLNALYDDVINLDPDDNKSHIDINIR
jgi:hypothetical protein